MSESPIGSVVVVAFESDHIQKEAFDNQYICEKTRKRGPTFIIVDERENNQSYDA